jgi:PAS domain-containing protein
VQCRDGTVLDAEIHGSVADIAGDRVLIGAAVDVSTHLDLARKLSDRERYFRALTEHISDVIFIIGPAGNVHYVSPSIEQHLGGHWTDWLECSLIERIHDDDRERFALALRKLPSIASFGRRSFASGT